MLCLINVVVVWRARQGNGHRVTFNLVLLCRCGRDDGGHGLLDHKFFIFVVMLFRGARGGGPPPHIIFFIYIKHIF